LTFALNLYRTDLCHVPGMSRLTRIRAFAADERGATAIEYALIALLITVGIVAGLSTIGGKLSDLIGTVSAAF